MNSEFNKKCFGLGKRKKATARVFIQEGKGQLIINKLSGNKYLQYNENYLKLIKSPFEKLNLTKNYDIIILVKGGGLTGQAEAIRLGISRLLSKMNKENRVVLKSFGFLTRDARIKERKKYGLRKARKAPQYSKR